MSWLESEEGQRWSYNHHEPIPPIWLMTKDYTGYIADYMYWEEVENEPESATGETSTLLTR